MIVQFILQFFIPADNIHSAMIILFNPSKSILEAAICIPLHITRKVPHHKNVIRNSIPAVPTALKKVKLR